MHCSGALYLSVKLHERSLHFNNFFELVDEICKLMYMQIKVEKKDFIFYCVYVRAHKQCLRMVEAFCVWGVIRMVFFESRQHSEVITFADVNKMSN